MRIARQIRLVDNSKPPYWRKMSFAATLHPGSCLSGLNMNDRAAAVSIRACAANGNLVESIASHRSRFYWWIAIDLSYDATM